MSETFEGREKTRFPSLLVLGVLMAVVVIVVAFIVEPEYGFPVLLLTLICAGAAIGYRVIAGGNRDDADASDNIPRQPATEDRPLGDTPEAHDEINPHDLPLDNPGRHTAERLAAGAEGTTSGHEAGGAAGHRDDTEPVGADEAHRGARP